MIKLKQLILEKTLYHGTITDFIPSIEKYGLIPSVGEFVKTMYDLSDYDVDPDDYFQELIFATDKEQIEKAVTAISFQIGHKLGKDLHDITDEEFIKYGAIVVIQDGDEYFEQRPDKDERYVEYPYAVEPNDYYSEHIIRADYILTGNAMIRFLKRYNVWPRTFSDVSIKNKKEFLIKLAIKKNPQLSKDSILKTINSWDDKKINQTYRKYRS